MEPIKAPVWDDPVKPEPYRLRDPPRRPAFQNPCEEPENVHRNRTGSRPPEEWTQRGRRNAVWEIELDPKLIGPIECQEKVSEDHDEELHRVCLCTRRNGLQDTCPMTGCGGRPACLTMPLPSCQNSGFAVPERPRSRDVNFILCAQPSRHFPPPQIRKQPSSAPGYCNSVSSPF